MSCFGVGISDEFGGLIRYWYKNNECVLHRQIEHLFAIVFITNYTFDVNLMDFFYMFTLGTIVYKKVVPVMWSPFKYHIAGDHIKHAIVCNKTKHIYMHTYTANVKLRFISLSKMTQRSSIQLIPSGYNSGHFCTIIPICFSIICSDLNLLGTHCLNGQTRLLDLLYVIPCSNKAIM